MIFSDGKYKKPFIIIFLTDIFGPIFICYISLLFLSLSPLFLVLRYLRSFLCFDFPFREWKSIYSTFAQKRFHIEPLCFAFQVFAPALPTAKSALPFLEPSDLWRVLSFIHSLTQMHIHWGPAAGQAWQPPGVKQWMWQRTRTNDKLRLSLRPLSRGSISLSSFGALIKFCLCLYFNTYKIFWYFLDSGSSVGCLTTSTPLPSGFALETSHGSEMTASIHREVELMTLEFSGSVF